MVCFGSKTLQRKGFTSDNLAGMNEEENSFKRGKKESQNKKPRNGHANVDEKSSLKKEKVKTSKNGKPRKPRSNVDRDEHSERSSKIPTKNMKTTQKTSKHQTTTLRKRVDPETAKYFTEIGYLFENNEVDLEERFAICGNALEETRGKEVEVANDMIISHTIQRLLEGCDLEQLCSFLRSCGEGFPSIAMDKFGSHVAETALKSLSIHLQDEGSYSLIEDTLTKICEVVVLDAANVMSSRYGSHVLRSLLCLCKGVPLDALEEFHVTKRSTILAERLSCSPTEPGQLNPNNLQHSFPVLFNFLVREMLKHAKDEITSLRVNNYSSFVLQTALKLLKGDDQELLHAILILIGCDENNSAQGKFIDAARRQEVMALLEDTASSHLFEVIIEVAPEIMYNEFLNEVFKDSLFEISSHQCGNFVVQALVSSAKTSDQVDLIWKELGPKLESLLETGKSGVVASTLATCQRLQTHVHECCQALVAAASSQSDSPSCIVPHILFLESYFRQKSSWKWPVADKMHTLGCLMLQAIFRCSNKLIQPYITSISSMEDEHILQTAKDAGGSRVLEAFLCSDASAKQKIEVITKLRDHFGALALHASSSFAVEKCFAASNTSLKKTIAAQLLDMQAELSKTRHGPYLLKKLDIDGFARQPEQWKRNQSSKECIYREFQATFGSNTRLQEQTDSPEPSKRNHKRNEKMHDETDQGLDSSTTTPSIGPEFPGLETSMAKLELIGKKWGPKRGRAADSIAADSGKKQFMRNPKRISFLREPGKKRKSSASELADLAGKQTLSSGDVHKLFRLGTLSEIKQPGSERKPFVKKQKR